MDEKRYQRVEQLHRQLEEIEAQTVKVRAELHTAIRDAFPETHGQPVKRGVLAEVARRSGYTREHVAAIRDGRAQ